MQYVRKVTTFYYDCFKTCHQSNILHNIYNNIYLVLCNILEK